MTPNSLILKQYQEDNFQYFYHLVSNPQVMEYITGHALSEQEAREKFSQILKENQANPKLGYFAVSDSNAPKIMAYAKIVLTNSTEAEIGYVLPPEMWGKGYGNRICTLLITQCKELGFIEELIGLVSPENQASKRILQKNGFVFEKEDVHNSLSTEFYRLKIKSHNS